MMAKYKVVFSAPGRGKVWRNGEQLDGVLSVAVRGGVDELTVVTLEMVADGVDIDIDETEEAGDGG